MRPLYMKVQAFGPYADVMEYPMEQLGAEGIYLLSGHTGSGKTTLFDGISYALFRDGSGDERKEVILRNTAAVDTVTTRVELLFSVGDGLYRVVREYRPAGEKYKTDKRENTLHVYPSGNLEEEPVVYKKQKEVDAVLKQVLKVGKDQFSQIAMIAQGDFQKVLLSKTSERQEVYRQIFQTEKYNDLQEKIKTDFSKLEKEIGEIERGIAEKLKGVMACSFATGEDFDRVTPENLEDFLAMDEHFDQEENVKQAYYLRKNLTTDVNRELALMELRLSHVDMQEEFQLEEQTLQKERDDVTQYFREYARLEGVKKEKDAILEELRVGRERLSQVEGEKAEMAFYPARILALAEIQKALEGKLVIWEDVSRLDKALTSLEREKEEHETQVGVWKESLEKERAVYDSSVKAVEGLPDLRMAVKSLEDEEVTLQKTMEQLSAMGTLLQRYEVLQTKMEKDGGNYQERVTFHLQKVSAHSEVVASYIHHQAGFLAKELEEGFPCLVCGSTDHPHKAESGGLDKETLEADMARLEQEIDRANRDMKDSEKIFSQSKAKFHQCQGEVEQQGDMLLGTKDVSLMGALLLEKKENLPLEQVVSSLKAQRKACMELEQVSASLEGLSVSLTRGEESLRKTEDLLLDVASRGKALTAERLEKAQGLEGATGETLSQSLQGTVGEIREKEGLISAVEERLVACEKHCHGVEERKRALDEMEVSDELLGQRGSYELRQEDLSRKETSYRRKWDKLVAVLSGNQDIENYVKQKRKTNLSKLQQVEWMRPLNRVATGAMRKEDHGLKIGFETFVQQHYFADVLAEANVVYHRMNQGKYSLVPGVDRKSKGQVGLDVFIFEENTGVERAASTLSGGEAFQASLSLALGFSSSVQKKSGAVQMESLFLDEGFGSLDGLSLDKAIEALVSVAGQGRLIGVISHVESMKGIIDKKVLFQNDSNGVSVEFQI